MKAALSFDIIFILLFTTGCIEFSGIFDAINEASLAKRQQNCPFCKMINRWKLIRKIDYEKHFFAHISL